MDNDNKEINPEVVDENGDLEEEYNEELEENEEASEPKDSALNEEEILKRIYKGDLEDLPAQTSKIVRIFTSSTFTGIFIDLKT
jgi:hypothetical protein